ncbi:hypothetical protein [Hymenobacter jeollabukensis]|uniref:Uncharacterized protein n=1 Tax=Hymenobacter jeollabukensis TaxID=2025313 RepID=A0A5R8WNA8_9BACT|nr:hypothetical protein [Hymenobacter jeollabukensis]TLM91195.1 hypothetical protein FDY95_16510 [Hymenobacter jeollabukensis]
MALWHVSARNNSGLRLWRTGRYAFRVVEAGAPADLLTNYDYVLVHRKYEGALRSTGAQLQLTPVVVTDEVRGLVWRHYLEAAIRHEATGEEIWQSTAPGPLIRRMGPENDVFVSEALKTLLQLVDGQRLWFSYGLSWFA